MNRSRPLLLLSLLTLSCAQAPVRHLPVVDEMPAAPERASATSPTGDFVAFYPRATSVLPRKLDLSRYAIECSEPIGGRHFTLALRDDGKSALFLLSARKVTSLSGEIAFAAGDRGSMDWGFVYDRNGDGWADYLAHLEGTHPIETPEVAAQVPKRPAPEDERRRQGDPTALVTRDEGRLMVANARLLFIHCADDNFDGEVDAIVSALQDPDRWGWIYRRAVVRSRSHTRVVDEDWTFVDDIAVREGPVPREGDGRMPSILVFRSGEDLLQKASTWFLRDVNAGLRACRIPRGALPRE